MMFEESRRRQREEAGCGLVFLLAVFVTIFMAFVIPISISSCRSEIRPEQNYRVIDVTDSSGKTYRNLRPFGRDSFLDYHGNEYTFHGNYTAVTRMVSGEQYLKETGVENVEANH